MEKHEFRVAGGVCCTTTRSPSGAIDYAPLCDECKIVARRGGLRAIGSGSPSAAPRASTTKTAGMRAACPEHTPEQQAERDGNAAAIERVWGSKVTALLDLRNARCSDLRRWGAAAREEEAKVAALRRAATPPATPSDAEMTAAISEAAARGAERRENAELDALAMELYGVDGDTEIFTDATGIRDAYRSPENKRTARSAARIVAAGRQAMEERGRAFREHREAHRKAAPGLFGSVRAQVARAVIRDHSKPRPTSLPDNYDPTTGMVPDPYERAIEQRRAAQARKDEEFANRGRRRR